MKTISRRHSLTLIGQASTIVAAASVASFPVSASDNPDAELLALFEQYKVTEERLLDATEAADKAHWAARKHYPNYPDLIAGHTHLGVRFLMNETQINNHHRHLLTLRAIHAEGSEKLRLRKLAALEEHMRARREIDRHHGVDELLERVGAEDDDLADLGAKILSTPARTFAGLAAKLRLANVYEEFSTSGAGFSHDLLTSALEDAEGGAKGGAS